jgi:DNA-binding IscR family transcriptional regulator
MWLLNKAGFVQATRGTKGGYTLARPAEEIRLSEVIKILDADEIENHCESYTGVLDKCVHTGDCGIRPVIVGLARNCAGSFVANHARAACRRRSAKSTRLFTRFSGLKKVAKEF